MTATVRTFSPWAKFTICDRCNQMRYCHRTSRGRRWLCKECKGGK